MATESIYFNSKSIVGASSVVVGSTYLPQTTLQATGTTTLIGNVFVQGGVLYPPRPMTANTTSISGFAYGNGTYVAFAPEQYNPSMAYVAFDGDITTVSDSVSTGGSEVYASASPYGYSNTIVTAGGYSNTFDVTSTNYPGVYIQLQLPSAIVLEYYTIFPTSSNENSRSPGTWRVFGSTTGTVGSWVSLDSRASITWAAPQVSQTFYLSPLPVAYSYLRLSVQNLSGGGKILDVSQWNLYGRPTVPAMSILGGDLSISSGGGLGVGPGTIGSNVAIFSNIAGGQNAVVINSNAWVGIGTTNPTSTLHVVGNAYFQNTLSVGSGIQGSNVAIFSNVAGGQNAVVINSNAWVGIGTTNPTSTLTVNGNATFLNDTITVPFATMGTLSILSGATIGPSSTVLGSNLLVLSNASGNVTIFTGNTVGISNLAPATTLSVGGTISALGNVVTSNYGTCPPLTFRQGALGTNWITAGTNNVPVGIGSVNMQCGTGVTATNTLTVTYPLSYAGQPIVLLTAIGAGNSNIWVSTAPTTTNFVVTSNSAAQTFSWMSIGI